MPRALKDRAVAMIRRFFCLPPAPVAAGKVVPLARGAFPEAGTSPEKPGLQPAIVPGGKYSRGGAAEGALPESEQPHTLRQALYPLALLFTLAYLAMEAREFLQGSAFGPKGLSAEVYTALMGIFAFDQEIRRWRGSPDRDVLTAEFIIYAWWLSLLVAWVTFNSVPAGVYVMPQDMPRICVELLAVFGLKGGSRYLLQRGGPRDWQERILDHVRRNRSISSEEAVELLGVSLRTAQRRLTELEKKGLLKRVGDAGSGFRYELP